MTKAVQRRRGTASEHQTFTGLEGEITVNTTNNSVHVHDGSTAGGFELARADGSNTDGSSSDGIDLAAISETKADTAVDVFVYDTSKDSDGGAWRKRTQHTSWYNETLNTATRGSRREFPAVAVIVAESDTLTIYDGDDPDLPMWMVFNKNNNGNVNVGNMLHLYGSNTQRPFSGITAVNGHFAVCEGGSAGTLYDLNFVADNCNWITESTIYGGLYRGSIAERNDGNGVAHFSDTSVTLPVIVAKVCNDVAMTVLPNAPIDPATGLPVPTIAVATNGNGTYSTSIITESGTIYDIASDNTGTAVSVAFDGVSAVVTRSDGTVYVWDDAGAIAADGASPDATYSASSTPALLGTVSKVAA